jgi:hypothetical protein
MRDTHFAGTLALRHSAKALTSTCQAGARRMISFMKKSENLQPPSKPAEDNRFEQIRKTAAERHKKSDPDGSRRRARRIVEDNRLT